VKSMRLGSTVIDGAVLDLSNGSNADLSLLVSLATGSVSGIVQDESGKAAGAVVVLTEDGDDTDFEPRRTSAGADGKYTFANLRPGSYMLAAVEDDDPPTLMEKVEVGAGEKVTKDLKRQTPE
jgi:hypothetical protein